MVEDYYELLGVPRDATEREIKDAYREQIKESHPDVSDDREASERTKQLIEAKDVLTDERRRREYDRLGHDQFVAETPASDQDTDTDTGGDVSRSDHRSRQASAGGTERTDQQHRTAQQTGRRQHTGPSWSNSSGSDGVAGGRAETHQTWGTDQSYVVDESPGAFDLEHLFDSQQAIVLLGTTFIIYPILLAGALFPPFPAVANIIIGICMILVIGYLQSIPQIGIIVFGIWSVLLPIGLGPLTGISLVSLFGVLSVASVVFPFGLSVLTWLAITPSRQF